MQRMLRNKWLLGICLALLLAGLACALPFIGGSQPTAPAANPAPPPWLSFGSDCQPVHTSATSGGSIQNLDERGNTLEFLPQGQVACFLKVQVCSDIIARTKVINQAAGEKCPPELHFSYAPPIPVCCSAWEAAKASKIPCDPLQDADCDGRLNALDNYLLDWTK
jgi:hypothetical protein